MAIEDHPKFPEWLQAYEEMADAWDAYTTAKAFQPKEDHSALAERLRKAKRRFNEISDQVD